MMRTGWLGGNQDERVSGRAAADAAVACREILPRGLLTAGNACHASERFAAACFMQYERHRVSCIEKSRRNGKTGAYCIEINEIYAIRARSANMSWKIYADEQAAPLLH